MKKISQWDKLKSKWDISRLIPSMLNHYLVKMLKKKRENISTPSFQIKLWNKSADLLSRLELMILTQSWVCSL